MRDRYDEPRTDVLSPEGYLYAGERFLISDRDVNALADAILAQDEGLPVAGEEVEAEDEAASSLSAAHG
ncbi:MAG: hypothetical protein JNK72_24900 [Myxococcales bacterium]|nr:hypothetical protein [Myxococcales bacterium]